MCNSQGWQHLNRLTTFKHAPPFPSPPRAHLSSSLLSSCPFASSRLVKPGPGYRDNSVTMFDEELYSLANMVLLAHPYGQPTVLSSTNFFPDPTKDSRVDQSYEYFPSITLLAVLANDSAKLSWLTRETLVAITKIGSFSRMPAAAIVYGLVIV